MPSIHPTAFVSSEVTLGNNVIIGAYCVIGENVSLGDNIVVEPHAIISGHTSIGDNTVIHSFACIGGRPQDISYDNENTQLIIGKNCTIREHCVIHRGTIKDNSLTQIGDNCYLMCHSHIGHDCVLGNDVMVGPSTAIGGHTKIGTGVNISGLVAIHHMVRIGDNAMIGGGGVITRDIIPFGLTNKDGELSGVNVIGLKRIGIKKNDINEILAVFNDIKTSPKTFIEIIEDLKKSKNKKIIGLLKFLQLESKRGLARGKRND